MLTTEGTSHDLANACRPWIEHILKCFGPRRVMFGSDWPVCNISGPLDEKSWVAWKDVVKTSLGDPEHRLSDDDRTWIWHKTAMNAYRLK